MYKTSNCCSCPHCELELKNRCMAPEFCKPCSINEKNSVNQYSVCKSKCVLGYSIDEKK